MLSRRSTAVMSGLRIIAPLILATLLLPWASGPATPVIADHDVRHDPAARLQIVLKSIYINDISEPGYEQVGEFTFRMGISKLGEACPVEPYGELCKLAQYEIPDFDARERQLVKIDETIPGRLPAGWAADGSISALFGLPVYSGQAYRFWIDGADKDFMIWDNMGTLYHVMTEQDSWGIGTHLKRGTLNVDGTGAPAHFTAEFEVQLVPLPDLQPTSITILDLPGGTGKLPCVGIQNTGPGDAGPFQVALYVDAATPPAGIAEAGRLGAGQNGELCVEANLPTTGQHQLTAVVDEPRGIFEQIETNNRFVQAFAAARATSGGPGVAPPGGSGVATTDPGPPGASTNPPATGPARVDLIVKSVRVKGEEPRGDNDCDPGQNDVTVAIKNDGAAAAMNFIVRVLVDPEDDDAEERTLEKSVLTLDPGNDLDVRFDDVRLKKGEHTLAATVDARKTIAESKEDNNELKVPVKCKDEGD